MSTGQVKALLEGHTGPVVSVVFSPDGQTLASGSGDGTILLWDMAPYVTPSAASAIDAASPSLPAQTALLANYPNPFNSRTQIAYRLAAPGLVRLAIYNALGQPMRTLVDQFQAAGAYQVAWDARDQQGAAVATGVYVTRLYYPGGGADAAVAPPQVGAGASLHPNPATDVCGALLQHQKQPRPRAGRTCLSGSSSTCGAIARCAIGAWPKTRRRSLPCN